MPTYLMTSQWTRFFCSNNKSLANKTTNNFVNESHLFTQGKTIVKTYTTTAREPSMYSWFQANVLGKGVSHIAGDLSHAGGEPSVYSVSNLIRKLRLEDGGTALKPTPARYLGFFVSCCRLCLRVALLFHSRIVYTLKYWPQKQR